MANLKVFVMENNNGSYVRNTYPIKKDNTLQQLYDLIHCDLVDCREIEVDGEIFDLWFDEEFRLTNERLIATYLLDYGEGYYDFICGNYVITKHNDEGQTVGLSASDIRKLWKHTDINSLKLGMVLRNRR